MTRLLSLALLGAAACAATPVAPELERAQLAENRHDEASAMALYDSVLQSCEYGRKSGRDDCGDAASRKALLLERTDPRAAYSAWLVAVQRGQSPRTQARALVRAATLAEELESKQRARELAWQCVESFPDEMPSEDALRIGISLTDRAALQQKLAGLADKLARTDLGDDLLFAQLEQQLGDDGALETAVAIADRLWREHPRSSLRDDGLWRAIQALRAARRPREALQRIQILLDTRRDAYLTGSYNSEFLDDALLEKGRILRDDLQDDAQAIDAFSALASEWPESRLQDDGLLEQARTVGKRDRATACKLLAQIPVRFPDGNQVSAAAREASALGCAEPRR